MLEAGRPRSAMRRRRRAVARDDPNVGVGHAIEFTILMPCLNEARDRRNVRREGAGIPARAPASRAKSSSPTTGRPTARSARERRRAPASSSARARLRQRAAGRHRRRARPLRDHGRCRRQLRFQPARGFVERLRGGDELVMGNRFAGGIAPGRDAAVASLPRQSGAVLHRPACCSARASATSIADCAASTATRCSASGLFPQAWSSRAR